MISSLPLLKRLLDHKQSQKNFCKESLAMGFSGLGGRESRRVEGPRSGPPQ